MPTLVEHQPLPQEAGPIGKLKQIPPTLEVLGTLSGAVGVGALLTGFAIGVFSSADQALRILPFLYVVANSLIYVAAVTRPACGAISMMISFFFLFFVAVPAMVQGGAGIYPFGGSYSAQQLVGGYAVTLVGQICLVFGVVWGHRWRWRAPEAAVAADEVRLVRSAVALTVISIIVVGYVGIAFATESRVDAATSPTAEGMRTQLLLAGRAISLLGLVIALFLMRRNPGMRRRPGSWVLLGGVAGVYFMLNYPSSLPRFQLLGSLIAVVCVLVPTFQTGMKLVFAVTAPFFLLFLFPAIKTLGSGDGIDFGAALGGNVHGYLLSVDFDAFKQTVDTWIYVHMHGYRDGSNMIGAALFWVPRSLWHDKPIHSGAVVSGALGYPYTNVSSPLMAEGLISCGFVGVLLLCLAVGVLVGRLEARTRAAAKQVEADGWILAYALASGFSIILLRGALNAVVPMIGPGIIACLIVIRASTRRGVSGD